MLKHLFQYIKFKIMQFKTSKYILSGKCKKCGNCCRSIIFRNGDNSWIRTEEEFFELSKKDKHLNNFIISGEDEQGRLLFTCRYLGDNNLCKVHFIRSLYCRMYPFTKSGIFTKTLFIPEDCGYTLEVDKPFKDYLKG